MASYLPSTQALLCFDAVAQELSVTRAAARLNMTQSAVSRQLSGLEQGLGVQLFRREKQRLYLSEKGQGYWEEVRELLRRLHSAGQRAQGKVSGRIRLGLEPALASRWLVPRLGAFKQRHPELDIQLQTELDKLYHQSDSYDIAILYGLGDWRDLEATPLMEDSLLAVCAPALLQQFGPIEARADALRYPLLHHTAQPSSSGAWLRAAGLKDAQIEALPGSRLESFSLIAQVASQGLGLAILPDYFVAAELQAGALVQACDRPLPCDESYFIVTAKGRGQDPAIEAVQRCLLGL
ncbi:MAG: LysR substrate-binding domain-containing protein [Cellvibrionaceae bacterium]|nr:LysR substrate-binding domain-containing protein [Cellvibrionaceae bacterium]